EAGMGFAVVADEVRNLAQRNAPAAKDTALLLEESIEKSNAGSARLDRVAESVRKITGGAAQGKTLVHSLDAPHQQQPRSIEQIAAAAGQLEQVTQKNAASAERVASAGEQLTSYSNGLVALVQKLRELSGESAGAAAAQLVPSSGAVTRPGARPLHASRVPA